MATSKRSKFDFQESPAFDFQEEPLIESRSLGQNFGRSALSALGAGINEQSWGAINPLQSFQQEYPRAATAGRVGSYITPGLGEERALGKAATALKTITPRGVIGGIESGGKYLVNKAANAAPESISGITHFAGDVAKTPAVIGLFGAARQAGRDVGEEHHVPGMDAVNAGVDAATDPTALKFGYGLQGLGMLSRAIQAPEHVYTAAGTSTPQGGRATSLQNARTLLDLGIRGPIEDVGPFTGQKTQVDSALGTAGRARSKIIGDAYNKDPGMRIQPEVVMQPLLDSGEMINKGNGPAFTNAANDYFGAAGKIMASAPEGGWNIHEIEDFRRGLARAGRGMNNSFDGPKFTTNEASVIGASKGLNNAIRGTLGEQAVSDLAAQNKNIGALSDAADNIGMQQDKVGAGVRGAQDPTTAGLKPLRKAVVAPLATYGGSVLDFLSNPASSSYTGGGTSAILQNMLKQRADQ